jgi:hypothetical protein
MVHCAIDRGEKGRDWESKTNKEVSKRLGELRATAALLAWLE